MARAGPGPWCRGSGGPSQAAQLGLLLGGGLPRGVPFCSLTCPARPSGPDGQGRGPGLGISARLCPGVWAACPGPASPTSLPSGRCWAGRGEECSVGPHFLWLLWKCNLGPPLPVCSGERPAVGRARANPTVRGEQQAPLPQPLPQQRGLSERGTRGARPVAPHALGSRMSGWFPGGQLLPWEPQPMRPLPFPPSRAAGSALGAASLAGLWAPRASGHRLLSGQSLAGEPRHSTQGGPGPGLQLAGV